MIQQCSWPAATFDALVTDMARHLRSHGFSVVSDVDVQAMLKDGLGVDSARCRILRTCDLRGAADGGDDTAVSARCCQVIVRETSGHGAELHVIDPVAARQGIAPSRGSTAAQVHRALSDIVSQLGL
jgi:uncharacterized protein (DUF302 family)